MELEVRQSDIITNILLVDTTQEPTSIHQEEEQINMGVIIRE